MDVLISSEWTTITPQPPLRVKKQLQKISLGFENCRQRTNESNLIFSDGTVVDPKSEIQVELFDANGNKYILKSGEFRVIDFDLKSETFAVSHAGFHNRTGNLTNDGNYTKVRIRSDKSFVCKNIVWVCYKLK